MRVPTATQRPRRQALAVLPVLLVLALTQAWGIGRPAQAARPPEGRTYFTYAMGLDDPYDFQAECFEFGESGLCSLDGRICGTWTPPARRGSESGFAFELAALDEDGLPASLEGRGRVDTRGRRSSVAGTGLFTRGGEATNFSFAGREVDPIRCLELLEASQPDDDRPVVIGSGIVVTESRDVDQFTAVVLNGVGRVAIRHGSTESLTITADDNILPILRSEVRDGRLLLTADPDRLFRTDNDILYEITVRELDALTVSGVAGVTARGIDTEELTVDIAGVSVVTLAGRVDRQILTMTGVSVYEARDLRSSVARVRVEGFSRAVVRVQDELTGSLAGLSTLEYIGRPRLDVDVAPGCTLRRID